MDVKYKLGKKLSFRYEDDGKQEEVKGIVVDNTKLPGDICVQWENGQFSSYDEAWLDENVVLNDTIDE